VASVPKFFPLIAKTDFKIGLVEIVERLVMYGKLEFVKVKVPPVALKVPYVTFMVAVLVPGGA